MARVRDVTDEVLDDSSHGPGEYVARVAKTKPAREQTPTIMETLAAWERRSDKTMGHISKPLAYSRAVRGRAREHGNLIRAIKGGHLRVCEVNGPPPAGSDAHRDAPYSDRYYILRPDCPAELPDGALAGRRKR